MLKSKQNHKIFFGKTLDYCLRAHLHFLGLDQRDLIDISHKKLMSKKGPTKIIEQQRFYKCCANQTMAKYLQKKLSSYPQQSSKWWPCCYEGVGFELELKRIYQKYITILYFLFVVKDIRNS